MNKERYWFSACGWLLFFGCHLTGCSEPVVKNKSYAFVPDSSIRKGKALAAQYCASCHALPEPALLDAKSWDKGVLPQMGPRLGIFYHNNDSYPSSRYDMAVPANFYPSKPVITALQWQHIINYYRATAPDSLSRDKAYDTLGALTLFEEQPLDLHYTNAMTSLVKIFEGDTAHRLWISDAGTKNNYWVNAQGQLRDSLKLKGPVVHIEPHGDSLLVCNIGVLNPNNNSFGEATWLHKSDSGAGQAGGMGFLKSLHRPVQISAADFNADGKTDYLVCAFGYTIGSLSLMENKGNGTYQEHVLRPLPGPVKAIIKDENKDGKPDIWVLFAQGEEGVFLYMNKGNFRFEEKQVLRFPSVYGSSYFEMKDLNGDGFDDIIYTAGDNADYSPVLKPYHGLYIFLNDGNNRFHQKYFYAINGCYKAVAEDFDKDGDYDLACIAFFADYKNRPEEGFVYLENKGAFDFSPQTIEAAKKGKWLTMDVGDMDGDGWKDIVLGNFCIGPQPAQLKYDWRKQAPALILKNKGKP